MGHHKKGGFLKAILKLITLGGLLVVLYKALQQSKEDQGKK
ncbi:MAG TPA: hypothetical protein VJK25_01785 [Patescibacteria group bacterium]|nr:hypothetical protein [Patescibacteria group bacterium]